MDLALSSFSIVSKQLYRSLYALAILTTATAIGSCSLGDSGVTYNDFRKRASFLAGNNAIDCGNSAIGQASEQNTCIGTAFVARSAAYATYDGQGVDSQVATALTITASSEVYLLFFDSDPTGGGGSSNGEISTRECSNASLSGILDGQPTEVFNCD